MPPRLRVERNDRGLPLDPSKERFRDNRHARLAAIDPDALQARLRPRFEAVPQLSTRPAISGNRSRASRAAAPSPAMAGRLRPARRLRSCEPPRIRGSSRVPFRM